jgi:hypothetical protein
MTKTRRQTETFEFSPSEVSRVVAFLETLSDAGDGWINLLPGIEERDEDNLKTSQGAFSLIFGGKPPPVTMGTLMPPKPARAPFEGVTIGLLHPVGAKAVRQLAELGVTVPAGWVVRQDHTRRGILIRSSVGAPAGEIVNWTIRAGTALCREEMTGQWQAVVYLP